MIEILQQCKELLKFFTSNAVTFATADNSIAATGIGTNTVTAGESFRIAGAAQAGNNRTFTARTVTADKIVVVELVTAESTGATVTLNEEYIGAWKRVSNMTDIVGTITTSHNCTVLIDFSQDEVNVDHSVSIAVTGGTSQKINEAVVAPFARLRILNGGTNQTTLRVSINGRR